MCERGINCFSVFSIILVDFGTVAIVWYFFADQLIYQFVISETNAFKDFLRDCMAPEKLLDNDTLRLETDVLSLKCKKKRIFTTIHSLTYCIKELKQL
jgi:hypothetical protein